MKDIKDGKKHIMQPNQMNSKMVKIVFLIILTILSIEITAQVEGLGEKDLTFSFSTSESRIELILNRDSVFNYYIKAPFLRKETSGTWSVVNNALILNSFNSKKEKKQEVIESYNPEISKRKCNFDVINMKGSHLTFNIRFIYEKEVNEKVRYGQSSPVVLEVDKNLKGFIIENAFSYVKHYIINNKANNFSIKLNEKIIFQNEEWFFQKGKIKPRGFDGELTEYYLTVE